MCLIFAEESLYKWRLAEEGHQVLWIRGKSWVATILVLQLGSKVCPLFCSPHTPHYVIMSCSRYDNTVAMKLFECSIRVFWWVYNTSIEYTISMERFAGLYFCGSLVLKKSTKVFLWTYFKLRIMALFKHEAPQKFSCKNFIGFESVTV